MKINDKYLIKNVTQESEALREALDEAQLSGTGATVDKYEAELTAFFGASKALAQSSGSAGLHTALYNLDVREGDEVLVPAIAPIPSVLPILTAKAVPVVVDIETNGLGFDPEDLRKKITPKTKAAMAVPLWGYPIDYGITLKILAEHGIPLIEDAAQAHGTKIRGQYVGTFGKVGCFSTHDRKILATGEGGFILTDDAALYEKMKKFSQLGYMDGKTYGVNYKLSALQAALGKFRIAQIDGQIAQRTLNVQLIVDRIAETKIRAFPIVQEGIANFYSLVLLLPWDPQRNREFIEALDRQGISSDITKYGFCPIYQRPMFEHLRTVCPNAETFIKQMTTVPVHPGLSQEEVEYVAETIRSTYDEFARGS